MADFSPFGFNWQYSQTVSANALSPIVEYPWNPIMSGYTGDLCVAYLPDGAGALDADYSGFVYPAPVPTLPSAVSPNEVITYPPIIGVIVGFKYKSAKSIQNPLNGIDTAPFYNPEVTPIVSGSPVTVQVITDPAAIYSVQTNNTSTPTTGVAQTSLFYVGPVTAAATYTKVIGTTPNDLTYYFAKGDDNTGQSLMYLAANGLQDPGLQSLGDRRTLPLQIVGITESGTNDWSTPSDLQPNNIVNVRLKLNLIVSSDYNQTA
jgi:hypothetical protein